LPPGGAVFFSWACFFLCWRMLTHADAWQVGRGWAWFYPSWKVKKKRCTSYCLF
jgi:hypothetical protein